MDLRLAQLLASGADAGGESTNTWVRGTCELQSLYREFSLREIQIKDLERGLIDFPAMIGGREAFLCWEQGENDIEYWHDLDAGFPGRQKL